MLPHSSQFTSRKRKCEAVYDPPMEKLPKWEDTPKVLRTMDDRYGAHFSSWISSPSSLPHLVPHLVRHARHYSLERFLHVLTHLTRAWCPVSSARLVRMIWSQWERSRRHEEAEDPAPTFSSSASRTESMNTPFSLDLSSPMATGPSTSNNKPSSKGSFSLEQRHAWLCAQLCQRRDISWTQVYLHTLCLKAPSLWSMRIMALVVAKWSVDRVSSLLSNCSWIHPKARASLLANVMSARAGFWADPRALPPHPSSPLSPKSCFSGNPYPSKLSSYLYLPPHPPSPLPQGLSDPPCQPSSPSPSHSSHGVWSMDGKALEEYAGQDPGPLYP
ncbi:MAG: hypothetical protein DHS80DRAFT_24208 [Piptocephalis tieghemiana]|nr:MAG: hypothetical protein DHS80DRAFT_24208 [Piptocephalis tieghemiana]